jgi:hypothetical protein
VKKYFLIFLFIIGCSTNQNQPKNSFSNLDFYKDLSIEDFIIKVEEYANNSPFPNIDN